MEKKKVYINVSGGNIQDVFANSEGIEVIIIDEDNPSLSVDGKPRIKKKFDLWVNKQWAEILKKQIDQEVDVVADGNYVQNDFRGTLIDVQKDTDGSYYATVRDMDDEHFDIDVMNVFPETI